MKQRIITGVIGGLGFLSLVYYGGIPYTLLITLLAIIGYYELLRMNNLSFLSMEGMIGVLLTIAIIFEENPILPLFEQLDARMMTLLAMTLLLIFIVLKKNRITFEKMGYLLLGALYVGFGFSYMISTRLLEEGLALTLIVLLATWASDSGAYFVGSKFGRHRFTEISPKKTIEGVLGGTIFAVITSIVTNLFVSIYDIPTIILLGILISLTGTLGDLVESALKRSMKVKDSGALLPGHGGVLDRFDSLIFIFPVLHIVQLL